MRHRIAGRQFSIDTDHRKAMLRNLAAGLFEHGQIETTISRAKAVQPMIEKIITIAKKGTFSSRRLITSRLTDRQIHVWVADPNVKDWKKDNAYFEKTLTISPHSRMLRKAHLMKRQTSQDALKSQSDFHRKLQKRQFAPLYLFEGAETYLRDQALKALTEAAVDVGLRDFNYTAISVAQGNLDEALGMARQFPMISERRMVVVTGFEAISDDGQLEVLKAYLRQPVETTVLAFVSSWTRQPAQHFDDAAEGLRSRRFRGAR